VPGFADLHNHQFAYLGFGGLAFQGRAYGTSSRALRHCDAPVTVDGFPVSPHGAGGTGDLLGQAIKAEYSGGTGIPVPLLAGGHLVGGHDEYDGWPRWDSVSHQAVYQDWLRRAVDGGLRLMVMLAVNNEHFAEAAFSPLGSDDMEAVDRQLDAAWAMQAYVDRHAGGSGRGWYRIVQSADEAERVIADGKLAVVLGIEVDYLFGKTRYGRVSDLEATLDAYYDRGVRHLFPVHFGNNLFAGAAYSNGLQAQAGTVDLNPIHLFSKKYTISVEPAGQFGYEYEGGVRNVLGLTTAGRLLVSLMMARGMIIDVDHMSARARDETLTTTEALGYPVVSGHTGFVEISKREKRHEGNLLPEEVDRIRDSGGLIACILNQGKLGGIGTYRGGPVSVEHQCGATSETWAQAYLYAATKMNGGAVAFGSDFNGFAGLPGPRFGAERCPGGPDVMALTAMDVAGTRVNARRMRYPFTAAATGARMGRSQVGRKSFDFNDDGLAHVGMLPDLIADLQTLGLRQRDLQPLLSSADAYVALWAKAESLMPKTGTLVEYEKEQYRNTYGVRPGSFCGSGTAETVRGTPMDCSCQEVLPNGRVLCRWRHS